MDLAPQPFVVTNSGSKDEAPAGAKPIALYHVDETPEITPQSAPSVSGTAEDPATVGDLKALIKALVAAGVLKR